MVERFNFLSCSSLDCKWVVFIVLWGKVETMLDGPALWQAGNGTNQSIPLTKNKIIAMKKDIARRKVER